MITTIHQSMVGSWLRCGEAFRRRYIEGEIMPPGITARRGSATHKAAHINHVQKIKTAVDLPLNDLKDATRDEYVSLLTNEGVYIPKEQLSEKKKILNEGLNEALQATAIYHGQIAPKIQPISTEATFEADIPGIPLPVRGTLDCEDAAGFIHDLKVMKRKSQEWADHTIQPSFYYMLYRAAHGQWPRGFKFQMVIPNKEMIHEELVTTRDMQKLKILFRIIDAFLKDLKNGNFKPADPSSYICSPEWCGYANSCPYFS